MTRICNFPISETKRCKQPVADGRPNCGRHYCEISTQQLGQNPTVYKKDGELHIWADKPDSVYCLVHSDPAYQALCQVAGETPRCCLRDGIAWKDDHNKLHREDGPARIDLDGTQQWYWHGWLHRNDGPAIIKLDGTQKWYLNGERHRDDGPAEVYPGGTLVWYVDGELHREDGPAVMRADGSRIWYWHDEKVTEEEHARLREQSTNARPRSA